jgi:hypothetical protein
MQNQRQGKVERVILDRIEATRNRQPGDTTPRVLEIHQWLIELDVHGFEPSRSAKVATRAAMRRFVQKHPRFALERRKKSWGESELVLFDPEWRASYEKHAAKLEQKRQERVKWQHARTEEYELLGIPDGFSCADLYEAHCRFLLANERLINEPWLEELARTEEKSEYAAEQYAKVRERLGLSPSVISERDASDHGLLQLRKLGYSV